MVEQSSSDYHNSTTADELTQRNVAMVADLENAAKAKRTPTDRVVDGITSFCGSMGFIWVHVVWFSLWMGINILHHVPKPLHFDPYPWPLLLMIVNLEAIFLSTFILISQNRQHRLAERRSHLDLQVNLLSEQENTKVLAMLDAIQKHLGITDTDPDVSVLEQATQPDRLVRQIEAVIEREGKVGEDADG